jgi:hypothetical protein
MLQEEHAHALLMAAFEKGAAEVFPPAESASPEDLAAAKRGADLLVAAKLVKFSDESRTAVAPTNADRYWALNGGYMAFLKEPDVGRGRERNPELEETRLSLMRLRLNTFWWTFGLSVAGFLISIISLVVALTLSARLLPL